MYFTDASQGRENEICVDDVEMRRTAPTPLRQPMKGNPMTKVCVRGFTLSLDGYGAGARQSEAEPLGIGGERLHAWLVATRTFNEMNGREGGTTGFDDAVARRMGEGFGASIMGRNMFGPIRGDWPDETWRGWWGEKPPYGYPVFVLTHHARRSVEMEGGTTFHFVTGGVREAYERACEAAGDKDVLVNGGASTIRQLLQERLIDELDLAISPILLGEGERLLGDLGDGFADDYRCVSMESSDAATHVRLRLQRAAGA
jgi:dihydrofolate reductase